jgi:hypothetical protein
MTKITFLHSHRNIPFSAINQNIPRESTHILTTILGDNCEIIRMSFWMDMSKNRRNCFAGYCLEPIHFCPAESQGGDMNSLKRRFEKERSVSSFINMISRERANEHLWEEMLICCLNDFWVWIRVLEATTVLSFCFFDIVSCQPSPFNLCLFWLFRMISKCSLSANDSASTPADQVMNNENALNMPQHWVAFSMLHPEFGCEGQMVQIALIKCQVMSNRLAKTEESFTSAAVMNSSPHSQNGLDRQTIERDWNSLESSDCSTGCN